MRAILAWSVASMLGAGAVTAQSFDLRDPSVPRMEPSNGWTTVVRLGDLDGDGDLDAYAAKRGNGGERDLLYLNDSGSFTVSAALPAHYFETEAVCLGDVDGDGDLDVIAAAHTYTPIHPGTVLYLNSGGSFTDGSGRFPAMGEEPDTVAAVDVDGDGDLDVLFAFAHGPGSDELRLFLNDGAGTFTDGSSQVPPGLGTSHLATEDVDGDGDPDVLLDSIPSGTLLLVNDGSGRFTSAPGRFPGSAGGELVLADVDGDGDADGLVGASQLFINDGSGTFALSPLGLPVGAATAAFGDLDQDGDADLLLGYVAAPNRLLLNVGFGGFAEASRSFHPSADHTHSVALGDLDRDGDLDVLVGNYGHQDRVYINVDVGRFEDRGTPFPAEPDEVASLALGDVDGDGDLDVLAGNVPNLDWNLQAVGGQNRFYRNAGAGRFIAVRGLIDQVEECSRAACLSDVDGDGDLDAFFGNDGVPSRLYLNDGQGQYSDVSTLLSGLTRPIQAAAFGDVDGDGDPDLVLGCSGQDALLLNSGSGTFTLAANQIPADNDVTRAVALGDVDGDEDLDLILGNEGPNRLLLNDGAGHFSDATTWLPPSTQSTRALALGDVDADGDPDLVVGNGVDFRSGEPNVLLLNDGTGRFTLQPTALPAVANTTSALALGDLDGDGDLDLVMAEIPRIDPLSGQFSQGQNRLLLNDGTGVYGDATALMPQDDLSWSLSLKVADLDLDGDLDVLTGNSPFWTPNRQLGQQGGGISLAANYGTQLQATITSSQHVFQIWATPGNPWLLFFSPETTILPLPPLGTLQLAPGNLFIVAGGYLAPNRLGVVAIPVPRDPTLVGPTFYWQAAHGPPVHLTNLVTTQITG